MTAVDTERILELMAAIRRKHQINAQPLSRGVERPELVSRRRG